VITVERREQIRRAYHIEHKSIRQIARELQVSRKTVDAALRSAEAAVYTLTAPRAAPVLGPYRDRIAAMLAENAQLPPKQRQTSHTMFVRITQRVPGRGLSRLRIQCPYLSGPAPARPAQTQTVLAPGV